MRRDADYCVGCNQPIRNVLSCKKCYELFCSEACLVAHYRLTKHGKVPAPASAESGVKSAAESMQSCGTCIMTVALLVIFGIVCLYCLAAIGSAGR